MRRKRGTGTGALTLWADVMRSGLATVTTLSVRVPQLAAGTMTARERERMVAEKVAAVAEGAVAASMLAGRMAARGFMDRMATRGFEPPTPSDLLRLADVASRPARTRVKANARRLGGAPKRRPSKG